MMRSVYISGSILLVSMGLAWLRWTAEPDKIGDNEVLVMQGKSDDIENISYVSTDMEVSITVKEDTSGKYLWVEYIDKKNPEEPQSKNFKAGKNGDKLLESLSPLVGIRELNDVEDKLDTLGLKSPEKVVSITRNGKQRIFDIGAETFGTKDYYVRDTQSNEIFLVDDRKFTSLFKARTSLPDRSLWSTKAETAVSASITSGEKTLSLTHNNWQDKQTEQWIRTNSPETDNTQLETWLGKFFRLTASRYEGKDDKLQDLQKSFTVTLNWENDNSQTLIIYQQEKEWWAESEHTRTKVKLTGNAISSLNEDLPGILE
jgi:hypothetical protein